MESEKNLTLSSSNLGSYALSKTSLKLPAYNQYIIDIRNKIPAFNAFGYVSENMKFYAFNENPNIEKLINEYDCIQYNELFDKKNQLQNFFELVERRAEALLPC